jgi:hypothetical protein
MTSLRDIHVLRLSFDNKRSAAGLTVTRRLVIFSLPLKILVEFTLGFQNPKKPIETLQKFKGAALRPLSEKKPLFLLLHQAIRALLALLYSLLGTTT